MSEDVVYFHVPGFTRLDPPESRAWHARKPYANERMWVALCGFVYGLDARHVAPDEADRVPPNAHLCGSCARVIAARTDVEEPVAA